MSNHSAVDAAFDAWTRQNDPRIYPAERQAFEAGWQAAFVSRDANSDPDGWANQSGQVVWIDEEISIPNWTDYYTIPVWRSPQVAAAQQDASTAREGWKLVPVRHTLDMSIAFAEAWYSKHRAIDDDDMQDAYLAMIEAAPPHPGQQAQQPASAPAQEYSYASRQATTCAGCGQHKHTPLRIDAMDGYVCLTCIDQKLGSLLGEFGYPAPADAPKGEPSHDDALDLLSEYGDHNIEHGRIAFDKWTLREAGAALLARYTTPTVTSPPDAWKRAVDHELTTLQSTADSYASPTEAVRALIDWHVYVALDPAVSSAAAAIRNQALDEAARTCELRSESSMRWKMKSDAAVEMACAKAIRALETDQQEQK